jgi:hypothetical protein
VTAAVLVAVVGGLAGAHVLGGGVALPALVLGLVAGNVAADALATRLWGPARGRGVSMRRLVDRRAPDRAPAFSWLVDWLETGPVPVDGLRRVLVVGEPGAETTISPGHAPDPDGLEALLFAVCPNAREAGVAHEQAVEFTAQVLNSTLRRRAEWRPAASGQ